MKSSKHRETALVSIGNARAIAADARLLLENGRAARALSLAVIGCEEAGKALLHTFAALDLAPNVVSAFEKRNWNSPLLNHLFKLLTVEMIGGADSELESYEMAADGELPPYPRAERTARIICGCARTLSDMFAEAKGAAAGKAWFDHIRQMVARPEFLPPYESPDDEKMRGLYVDLGRSSGQPNDVDSRDADLRLSTLSYTLSVLAFLNECLKDDVLWEGLADEVQQVRDQYT